MHFIIISFARHSQHGSNKTKQKLFHWMSFSLWLCFLEYVFLCFLSPSQSHSLSLSLSLFVFLSCSLSLSLSSSLPAACFMSIFHFPLPLAFVHPPVPPPSHITRLSSIHPLPYSGAPLWPLGQVHHPPVPGADQSDGPRAGTRGARRSGERVWFGAIWTRAWHTRQVGGGHTHIDRQIFLGYSTLEVHSYLNKIKRPQWKKKDEDEKLCLYFCCCWRKQNNCPLSIWNFHFIILRRNNRVISPKSDLDSSLYWAAI